MGMGAAARRRGNRRMTTRPAIARLKVTLEDVEPAVMRRLDVPLTIRLDRLHLALQAAMGWTNSHLYEFRGWWQGLGRPRSRLRRRATAGPDSHALLA
jgi:Plasmid pRiA4b ORF-3-like protein